MKFLSEERILADSGRYYESRQFSGALTRKAFCLHQRVHTAKARWLICTARIS